MAEEARLESVYTPKAYPEFESRSLRIFNESRKQNCLRDFLPYNDKTDIIYNSRMQWSREDNRFIFGVA